MENKDVMHKFNSDNSKKSVVIKYIVSLSIVIILGIGSGYLLAGLSGGSSTKDNSSTSMPKDKDQIKKGQTYGSDDTDTFKDSAEGKLEPGGIEGEGQYHLVRPGGESQYVYLISSVVDLSLFKDRKIKVWGETQKAQKVGWLMDVGRVEVLE